MSSITNICSIEGCSSPQRVRGWCASHYKRWLKYGDPTVIMWQSHGLWQTPEYNSWHNMKSRCNNKKFVYYKNYGGRGIKVCQEWSNSFLAFYNDMGAKPSLKHSLDRIDNEGNYEKINCRWATASEQAQNRRPRIGTSKYRGVHWHRPSRAWSAHLSAGGRLIAIGTFKDEAEAAWMRDQYALQLYGPDVPTNFQYTTMSSEQTG